MGSAASVVIRETQRLAALLVGALRLEVWLAARHPALLLRRLMILSLTMLLLRVLSLHPLLLLPLLALLPLSVQPSPTN